MRIIGGKLKGSTLYLPKNKDTRPLKDMVRESIFNLLKHSNKVLFEVEKSSVLDLYSGTGSFGLECLSRQAKNVIFVEKEKDSIHILQKNIEKLKLESKTKIIFDDINKVTIEKKILHLKFDLIFCDPPFKNKDIVKLIDLISNSKLLKKNGIFVLHRNKKTNEIFPSFFNIIEERIYGISKIIFAKF
tara:strand:+ start:324 stop:887 length:564 start_codon:yes stop_codon:yes gene_type:complete